jgi:hypothetical protein
MKKKGVHAYIMIFYGQKTAKVSKIVDAEKAVRYFRQGEPLPGVARRAAAKPPERAENHAFRRSGLNAQNEVLSVTSY